MISETADFSESLFGLFMSLKPVKSQPPRKEDGRVLELRNIMGRSRTGNPILEIGLNDRLFNSSMLTSFIEELLQLLLGLDELLSDFDLR